MSSKNDSPKVMNVLERMGMVRKADAQEPEDYETLETGQAPAGERYVPQEPEVRQTVPVQDFFIPEYEPEPPIKPVVVRNEPKQSMYTFENKIGAGDNVNESSFWDDSPTVTTDTDRFMDVEEIYRALNIKTGGTDTIYLVEEYMRTLPDSLPAESRRAIIMKIVAASGFDFDKLLNDGIDRVTKLNEYAATFAQQTDKIVARHNSELDALEKQIQRVRELIGERKNLHKRQFLTIENEAQRLKEVLDFITK